MSLLELLRHEPRALGFGLMHTTASSVGQTFVIVLFLPGIKASLALDDAQIASVYGLATVASAGVLWWLGRWIDQVDVIHYSIASGLFLAFACALTAGATTLPLLAMGLFCLRLGGQGLLTHIAVTAIARYFTHARGKALSLTSIGHSLGEAVLPATIVLLIGAWGWRAAYLASGAFALQRRQPLSFGTNRSFDTLTDPAYPACLQRTAACMQRQLRIFCDRAISL